MDGDFFRSFALLAVLLNPFLLAVYLIDLIRGLKRGPFALVLFRGSVISGTVFVLFAAGGDAIFSDVLQVRFASFLLFGGVVFLIVALRFVFSGTRALEQMRGPPEHLAGSVAMPFMIGPGTVSASVLAGARLPIGLAAAAIGLALATAFVGVVGLKVLHDRVREHNERLVERYLEILGRIMALVIGTIALEMLLQGAELWLDAR